ncbi:dTDP-4-dehydrorhamnose reductase [Wukongibacter sp. M2B1]|uniref:dTDP-4-dehydrorhamnose reductase n=1 Tax=Wukongibacter sp. M2B1 TaxID=3088895 RepID=UPI003D7BC545
MKILITGSKGQLGSQIKDILERGTSQLGEIDGKYVKAVILETSKKELDITSLKNTRKVINKFRPSLVINTAAYTKVDECEDNIDIAFKVNALGAKNLALSCEEVGAKLVHISTDYVFSGASNSPYREYDIPRPVNVYGKTKYLGEEYVKEFCSQYFIVRTSWLYGYNGKNFVKTIINMSKEKELLKVVDDQKGKPTNIEDLVYHILKIALTDEYGIYHCSGKGVCSWYDFACKILELLNIDLRIIPIKSDESNRSAKRPNYSSLDNMMLRCTVGDEMRPWEEALEDFINKMK